MKNQKSQVMTLTLCLEDNTGKDTNLEVKPDDDFATFLERAEKILGYVPQITDITEGKTVSLKDNIYLFLIEAEMNKNVKKEPETEATEDEDEEFGEIEYLAEDEEEILKHEPSLATHIKKELEDDFEDEFQKIHDFEDFEKKVNLLEETKEEYDSEECVGTEYLEEDSDEPGIVDVEVLDSSLDDDDIYHSARMPIKKRRLSNINFDSTDDFINSNISESEQIYTTKELLNVLEDSDSDGNKTFKKLKGASLSNKIKIKNKLGSKYAIEKQSLHKKIKFGMKDKFKYSMNFSKSINNVKDITKSAFFARRQLEKGSDSLIKKQSRDKKLSSFDLAMLKRTVRQPVVSLSKVKNENSDSKSGVNFDESRYIPSNYEDVDNEGVFDYMEDSYNTSDVNDLLLERKIKNIYPKNKKSDREDVVKAVDGINKMMGVNKKNVTNKRPRGRPKKVLSVLNEDEAKNENVLDSHTTYLENIVKSEPIDDEDDDYVPGKTDLDWMKNKKKEKYNCRMCSTTFTRLSLAISHALSHRVPRKLVFPCILCAYGFTTYSELQKHMKTEHRHKRSPKKANQNSSSTVSSPKPKGKAKKYTKIQQSSYIKKKPLFLPSPEPILGHIEIMDDEEVCNVEMLEEWLEDEEEEIEQIEEIVTPDDAPQDTSVLQEDPKWIDNKENLVMEEAMEEDDEYLKQVNKTEENDFTASGDDEWLLDEGEEEAARVSDDSDAVKDTKSSQKRRKRKPKVRDFKCSICLCYFDSHNTLLNHKCIEIKDRRGTRGTYRCALCGQTFRTRFRLGVHRSFHQVELIESNLICKECPDKKFTSDADLFDHINNEHNIDFICEAPNCGKQFHLRSALRAHSRIHGKRSYQCQECGKQFSDIHNLKEHNVTHLAVKPFQCHICLKFLNRRSRLRMHLIAHESSPVENCVLVCKCCKMAFRDAVDAEAHIRDSEECKKNILESLDEDILLTFSGLNAEETSKNFIHKIDMINDNEISRIETTVDDIVNETLADNGIISLQDTNIVKSENVNTNEILSGDESMKALLAEVGTVKLILNEDETVGHILEDRNNIISGMSKITPKSETEQVDELFKEVTTIKDLLANVGTDVDTLSDPIIKSDTCEELSNNVTSVGGNELKIELTENNESLDEKEIKNEQREPKRLTKNKEIFTEEELMSQLKETTKLFVKVVKIKVAYRCEYCEKNYYTKDALNAHRTVHDGLRNPFICHVCNAAFSTFARCTSHKTTHGFYKLNTEEDTEKDGIDVNQYDLFPVIKYFVCQDCNKTFLHWTYLQVHKRHKHGKNTYYFNCKICGDKFTDSWSLNMHRKKMHAEYVNAKKSTSTSYKCADCGEGYNKRIELAKHRLDVHGDSTLMDFKNKPGLFACTQCDKIYQTKIGLDGHMRSHNGDIYICDLCGNSFAHRTGLETHYKRVHLREQRFVCRTCGQNFYSSVDFYDHRKCHTGERPFQCDFCPMLFRTKGRRNEHHRTHTGERPYRCDICGVAFRRSNAMKNHRLIHTGDKRHVCPYCPKLFHVHSNLKSHIKSKHPGFIILELDEGAQESVDNSLNMLNEPKTENMIVNDMTTNEPILVLQDVIIEDGNETILPDDGPSNIMEYTYETDMSADVQGHEISTDPVQYVDGTVIDAKDADVHIQLLNSTDHEQGLLYAVEDPTGGGDMQLIEGGVRYTLVEDMSDDHKPQFTIIDSHQFIKEDEDVKNAVYYT